MAESSSHNPSSPNSTPKEELVAELKNIQWELPAKLQALLVLVSLVKKQLKTLDSILSLLNKVTETLNPFATVVENTSGATTKDVPLVVQATASPAEGENNTTKDAKTKKIYIGKTGQLKSLQISKLVTYIWLNEERLYKLVLIEKKDGKLYMD
ncbi:hypothetical protein Tco_1295520 [Tanacetum coccineum]